MTIPVANTANTNSFFYWQTVTNQLAGAMSTAVITTTANGSTVQTAGNASLGGTMFANIHSANIVTANSVVYAGNSLANVSINATSISLANSSVSVNITTPTAAQVVTNQYWLNANGSWGQVTQSTTVVGNTVTSGTTTQTIDQFAMAAYRSAEYQINVWDNVANAHMMTKISIMHDTANTFATEYSQLYSNGAMGIFTHNVTGANVVLQFTPVSTNTQVRFIRVGT